MDWETLYCPNPACALYGVGFRNSRLVKNGTTRGQRQALCRACRSSVALTYGTPYFDLEHDPALFALAIRALAEGNAIRATARIVQVDKDTVYLWLDRAAQHCRLIMLHLWQQLPVRECQLDELWSFVHTKDGHLAWAKISRETYGDAWVWVAFAPEWRLVVAFVVGKRTQVEANLLLERVAYVTTELIPFFTSDQLPTSATINTSFVERENLAFRQHNRRLTRKTNACSKELPWLEKQLWLSLAYTHLVLPHDSLRQELPMCEPTRGSGSPRRWRLRTPAMAAALPDHVWTTDELL